MEDGQEKGRTGKKDAVTEAAADAIRERSAAAQLISEAELMELMRGHRPASPETGGSAEALTAALSKLIPQNDDLRRISGPGPQSYFYSVHHMTGAYAEILQHRLEGPLQLIAETVRNNARTYRRPVPVETFTRPPFGLERRQVLDCLKMMAETEGYDDIAATSTSASTTYLYSRTCLEDEHAAMLAEWLDVGQMDNP